MSILLGFLNIITLLISYSFFLRLELENKPSTEKTRRSLAIFILSFVGFLIILELISSQVYFQALNRWESTIFPFEDTPYIFRIFINPITILCSLVMVGYCIYKLWKNPKEVNKDFAKAGLVTMTFGVIFLGILLFDLRKRNRKLIKKER